MSPPGRPKGEYRSAQHEGHSIHPPGCPKGEYRSAQHERIPASRRPRAVAAGGALLAVIAWTCSAGAEEIGAVDTEFVLLGPDHKIVVEVFDDATVKGVACYVSRARTGGMKGAVGLAKDPSRFSVACRQVGPISFARPLPLQEEVFKEGASLVFKHVRVVRMVDVKRNTLTYLTYSDRVIDGFPDNAITAVPVPDQKIPVK
jgi:CreA protein